MASPTTQNRVSKARAEGDNCCDASSDGLHLEWTHKTSAKIANQVLLLVAWALLLASVAAILFVILRLLQWAEALSGRLS
jgi:hypothetical protein